MKLAGQMKSGTLLSVALLVLLGSDIARSAPDDVEALPQAQAPIAQFQMDEQNFDANVFQPSGNAKAARIQMEANLDVKLNEIDRICGLSDSQRNKLKLAASSDMKRFFDEVAVVRKKVKTGMIDQNAWNNIWQEIQPLRTRQSAGLFGESSFFTKSVRRALSKEQATAYNIVMNERRKFRYRASIEVVLVNVESSVSLRRSQHEALVTLLLEHTRPPKVFGQYNQYFVMNQLGKIPEDTLRQLLEDHQWTKLKLQIDQAQGMEPILIQNGITESEESETRDQSEGETGFNQAEQVKVAPEAPANATESEKGGF